MPAPSILIIGGGIVGLACARTLRRRGAAVRILEPGPLGGAATPAAGGMLAAQTEAHADDAFLRLAIRARQTAIAWAQALSAETDTDVGLLQLGIAHLAATPTEESEFRAVIARQRQLGLRAEWLEAEEVTERWPGVTAAIRGAGYAPDDAALDPEAFARALRRDAELYGTEWIPERVAALEARAGRVTGVRTHRTRHESDAVVLAAGAWSPTVGNLPRPLPIEPMRGQMAALPWPAATPPAIVYAAGGYVLRRATEALAGTTMESVGFDSAVTPDGLRHILAVARTILPALVEQHPRRSWAGLRPVTPDGLPIVGPDPELEGLWYATGHGRNGILLAGLTGEVLADLLLDGETAVDIGSWLPDRFAG